MYTLEDKVNKIANALSYEYRDIYYEKMRKRLYEHNELEVEYGLVDPNEPKPEPTDNERLIVATEELRLHAERFTVELILRLIDEGILFAPLPPDDTE